MHDGSDERLIHAWEDVKAMFNGGSRKRISISSPSFTPSSSFAQPARTNMSFESFLQRNKNSEADTQGRASYDNRQGMKNSSSNINNREIQSWTKLSMEKNLAPPHPSMSFPPASSMSLMPPASLGAGTAHPAFFAASLPSPVPPLSYGEFLRSMSRPYNVSSLPLPANTLLPDMCRGLPTSSFSPGMFGTNPYPLSYLGYPPYLPSSASVTSRSKGGNTGLFPSHLPDLREFRSDSNAINSEDKEIYGAKENTTIIPEHLKFTEDTQDEIIVDEEEDKEKIKDEKPTLPRTREESKDEKRGNATLLKQTHGKEEKEEQVSIATAECSEREKQGTQVQEGDQKEEKKETVREEEKETSDTEKEKKNSRNDNDEEKEQVLEEQKRKASSLPSDTDRLLAIFEATEDVDTFVHLPIETLRVLHRASKKKTRATDQELKKVKEMQRIQRQRAEELREQLSRQFFALKETIWTEIEKERKMRTALQDRLTETQKLTSQNYSMFTRLK